MSDQEEVEPLSEQSQATAQDEAAGVETAGGKRFTPWVTGASLAFCIGIFLGIHATGADDSTETMARFGWLPAEGVWHGGWWALVSTAFVHLEIWHLAFNAYWLWILGREMERAIGPVAQLVFVVASAFVSSAYQLALNGGTGIGASGFVYAMFGFMWVARRRWPAFGGVVHAQTVRLFVVWLFACIVATHLKILNVGNAAHASGLLFGVAVAGAVALPRRRVLMWLAAAVLLGGSIVTLLWCPWRAEWLGMKAYDAHDAGRLEEALSWYGKFMAKEPDAAWAYYNRADVYQQLGQMDKAAADLARGRQLDPAMEKRE